MTEPDRPSLSNALVALRNATVLGRAIESLVSEVRCVTDHYEIPVVPLKIAERLGIRIERVSLEAEGVLVEDSAEGPRILMRRTSKSESRDRFTLAHELGHLILRRELRRMVPESSFLEENAEEEQLCNLFAAELLMPAEALRPQLVPHGSRPSELFRIARNYRVSVQALARRTATMWPAALGTYWAMMWGTQKEQVVLRWGFPKEVLGAKLYDTGRTPVERAFAVAEEQSGRLRLNLDGRTVSMKATAHRIGASNTVLMIATVTREELRASRLGGAKPRPFSRPIRGVKS